MDEYSIVKPIGKFNVPMECWGCTTYPIYHAERLHTNRNRPNNIYPDVEELAKR